MKVKNNRTEKFIKIINGKTFYVVLCFCFIAVGVAAWSGIKGFENSAKDNSSSVKPESTVSTPSEAPTPTPSKPQETAKFPDSTPSAPSAASKPDKTDEKTEETAAPVAAFFVNPVLGDVLKGFSDTELQYSITMRDMRLHKAVDLTADIGTPVIAAGAGTVTAVEKGAFYGVTVEIDHGNGITAKYCGLNAEPCVKVGDEVDTSTQIGAVDTVPCESVEQHHLHLEFYKDGQAVSAMDYIGK